MESQHLGHEHPLIFNNQSEAKDNQSEAKAAAVKCSRCGEAIMFGPSFRCAAAECGFYVHKQCAEAPSEMNHPFHCDHPLCLLPNSPYRSKLYICNFCGEKAIAYKDPSSSSSASTGNNGNLCFECWEPLLYSVYCCLDGGFFKLHKKCVELPHELIDHPYHPKHPLILQLSGQFFSCANCLDTDRYGFCYRCSLCNFTIHIPCLSLSSPLIIEDKHHPHPFFQFSRDSPFTCDACGTEKKGGFPYMCSKCNLLLHKECISLPRVIKFFWHFKHPLFHTYSLQLQGEESSTLKCAVCRDKVDTCYGSYSCSHCQFMVHVNCVLKYSEWYEEIDPENYQCVELAHEINHPFHRQHPLTLQLAADQFFSCAICEDTYRHKLSYRCSPCNFTIHIACLSSPSIIKDKNHPHPFTQFLREFIFTCDACGSDKKGGFPYMCSECNLLHKKCISLPPIIKFFWHPQHPILHKYFLKGEESFQSWECVVCRDKVDTRYGSYSCLHCHFIVHVNCVLKYRSWYEEIDPEKYKDGNLITDSDDTSMESSMIVLKKNEDGEATEIQHFSHLHNLIMLSSDDHSINNKYCDGCTLSISLSYDPFHYYCSQSQCNFVLHKTCAEFPKKKHLWFHFYCGQPSILVSDKIFKCTRCWYVCNGFAYRCGECRDHICLRCVTPGDTLRCQGHQHPLSYYLDYQGQPCNACGVRVYSPWGAFKCMGCSGFALDFRCLVLPRKAPHKCDEHLFTLTYYDHNIYSLTHFCDICEQHRDPSLWLYHCAICDTYAHPNCVLGRYSFMKPGKIIYKQSKQLHQHDLIFVKKTHYYFPECFKCGDPCEELALECVNSECGYIVHWKCVAPLDRFGRLLK
ncbi:Zinc finger, PHD-type [Corchorus olitorius]|uniref:Zinc finger, PHD-type n=1 Tax=Corchorus olitorius TaxID=93759 RepID=A0A1R3JGK7_9ROSI|nr:Zinc finger, PHD-type [Corchorus olitorius]